MSWTTADVDALEEAIATGALSVRHGEKQVTYQNFETMQKILVIIKRSLQNPKPRSFSLGAYRRGA